MSSLEKRINKNTPANTEGDAAVETKHTRRLQDGITSKDPGRKLNLDRRTVNSERRAHDAPNYKGPARRYTIDRRLTTKDRRKSDYAIS